MIDCIWLNDEYAVSELVDLFVANVGTEYITHIEIEEGRATEEGEWSSELRNILNWQFYEGIKNNRIIAAIEDGRILGFALVLFNQDTIVIEDIISAQKGIGTDLLSAIECKARLYNYKMLIGDVGPNNERAKRFMEANGYTAKTIVYTKNI